MKFLFVGLGSIGQRHLKNLHTLVGNSNEDCVIDALRRTESQELPDFSGLIDNLYTDIADIPYDYDAVFITNPSNLHYETLLKVKDRTNAVFIEKPVFSTPDIDIASLNLKDDGIYYVACPLRRSPVLSRVSDMVRDKKPLAVRAICSSYLPDWRPSADYTKSYSANASMGGGVRLDLIHEWDYLVSLFGFPSRVESISSKVSNLSIDSEDIAIYIADYKDMTVSLHLDYFGRHAKREMELIFDDKTLKADILNNRIVFENENKTEVFSPADIHFLEMSYFLDLIKGRKENINTVAHAYKVVQLALK
ncbi:MAG: Gfo/Idh/MocA family oxidoreductase [Ruminococcaceae bacterium]|nr:Gfo/Idh/MocA family oxidoreductase [Oscillospiraceae bacterium]